MKTLVMTIVLAAFCLFQSQALAQKGSIDSLLLKGGDFVWGNTEVPTSAFDYDEGLDGEIHLTAITLSPGKETTASDIYDNIVTGGATPLNLKQTLQWMTTSNTPVKFVSTGENALCLGSHIHTDDGRIGYPVLVWKDGKWFIYITGDIRRVGEATVIVNQNH